MLGLTTATVVLNVWGLWFFRLEDAMNKWIVKKTRERECVMVKCKSQSKLCFQNCAGVNYSCPWWFMVSFDVHIGVPNKFYTPVNYEGPIWPASLSSTQLLLAKEGFVCKLPFHIPQLPKLHGQFAKPVNKGKVRSCSCICSLFFTRAAQCYWKA